MTSLKLVTVLILFHLYLIIKYFYNVINVSNDNNYQWYNSLLLFTYPNEILTPATQKYKTSRHFLTVRDRICTASL